MGYRSSKTVCQQNHLRLAFIIYPLKHHDWNKWQLQINYNDSKPGTTHQRILVKWNPWESRQDKHSENHFHRDVSKSQLKNSPQKKKKNFYTWLDSFFQWKNHHDSWWVYANEHESYKENKDRNRENQIKPNQTKPNNILK